MLETLVFNSRLKAPKKTVEKFAQKISSYSSFEHGLGLSTTFALQCLGWENWFHWLEVWVFLEDFRKFGFFEDGSFWKHTQKMYHFVELFPVGWIFWRCLQHYAGGMWTWILSRFWKWMFFRCEVMTSWKINMEPTKSPIWKGKSSSKPPYFFFHVNFPGCSLNMLQTPPIWERQSHLSTWQWFVTWQGMVHDLSSWCFHPCWLWDVNPANLKSPTLCYTPWT